MRRRRFTIGLLALACKPTGEESATADILTVRGSDTLVILAQTWAEGFMQRNPGARIQVSGGGSGTGFAALISGTADVATASRAIDPTEAQSVTKRREAPPVEIEVALDAIAIYVHEDNPIEAISMEQAKRIFRGRVESWAEVGVDLGPIVLYSRENNSGTYAYFKEHVLQDEDFAAEAQTLPGTAAVINAVSKDDNAIGYGGIGYASGVRALPIRLEDGTLVRPDASAAKAGRYPLARPLFMYTAGPPKGLAAGYIDFALSSQGQRLVEKLGFFPLPPREWS